MRRFFSEGLDISGGRITISDKDNVHHIRDVLRMQNKDSLIVFDGEGKEYRTQIERLTSVDVVLKIKEKRNAAAFKKFRVTLACAMPKNSKMDDIVDKLTQLGVDRIIPLQTKHVVVKLNKAKEGLRQQRWKKIARSASQQCQRSTVPVVNPIKNFKEFLAESRNFDLKVIPTLRGRRRPLKDVLRDRPGSILVAIGPEGDFSDEEVRSALAFGFIPVTLGDLVLRVETAAVAVAGYISLYSGAQEHK
jgi:16S rRNA (uracil1498-N3)-methyltransferase